MITCTPYVNCELFILTLEHIGLLDHIIHMKTDFDSISSYCVTRLILTS